MNLMKNIINAKQLRASLPEIVRKARQGTRFTVIYRSRPAFRIVPVEESKNLKLPLSSDGLYHAPAVGRSRDGVSAKDHDKVLYGR